MLQEQRCDMNGDLWALGCIIYQMFTDKTPFHQKQNSYDTLKQKILTCNYDMNPNIPEVAQDIIKQLLVLQPNERLGGVLVNGQLERQQIVESYKKLKSHPFFEGINWENLYQQEPPMALEHFVRRPTKKQTAPPLQSTLKRLSEQANFAQNQKKKQSEDLYDAQKNQSQSTLTSLSELPKTIYEKSLQEKQWKLIKVSRLVQIQESERFFTINVFENSKKTQKQYSLLIDQNTTISQKDQKVIINNGKSKKAYFDYKENKVVDFLNFLQTAMKNKYQKKSQ